MKNEPIRVLHFICSTGFYGAEKWILALANNLDRDLVESELVVTREPENQDLQLTKAFRDLQLTAHELPMSGRFDFSVINKLVKLIKERDIHVLHSHGYKSDIIGFVAAKLAGIKCITTPHGFEASDDWKLNLFIYLGCQSFRFFDWVVPLSTELCNDVKKYGVPDHKIKYIRNGVDLSAIDHRLPSQHRQLSGSSETTRTIGFIGQLIERKNVSDLLQIFDSVAQQFPDVKLVLLGDGYSRNQLESQAAKLKCAERIEFLGFSNEPLKYLESFDLFVMTSTLEGIPRCLMESMAMGVPVASYDIPGVDQLIQHNKTGLLAPFGDKKALEECWQALLWNTELADTISKQAAEYINADFSARRMAEEYTVVYEQLVPTARLQASIN